MDKKFSVPVLTDALRVCLEAHRSFDTKIKAENNRPSPNLADISRFKREKLRLKDEMKILFDNLPVSHFAPASPSLFVMTGDELYKELKARTRSLMRTSACVGPTSAELARKKAEVRDVEIEVERRELEEILLLENGDSTQMNISVIA